MNPSPSPEQMPHRRFNPLTGDWVLVSPQRTRRPWLGKREPPPATALPAYDPGCYLCPGNERAEGQRNPDYTDILVFDNDFPALLPEPANAPPGPGDPLLRREAVAGLCRVLCFSPRHDLTLPDLPVEAIRQVVDAWAGQCLELNGRYRWVQIFENKGEMMGCSNPHPHGQIWATDHLPVEAVKEDRRQRAHWQAGGTPLLLDVLARELSHGERLVEENAHWVALVPFWAVWPYETLLLPRRPVPRLPDLSPEERDALASILQRLLRRYDRLFAVPFPYSMGWHGAPGDAENPAYWQLHAHFYPPLLRSATVKKFMVGYEMLAEPQRDLTPEQAAEALRAVGEYL